jgi:hypothetical protein
MNTTVYCHIENYRRNAASAMQSWQRLLHDWPAGSNDERAWAEWQRQAQAAEAALSRCIAQIDAGSHRLQAWPGASPAVTLRSRPRTASGLTAAHLAAATLGSASLRRAGRAVHSA